MKTCPMEAKLFRGDRQIDRDKDEQKGMTNLIYLLTAIGLSPGGRNTHLHTNNT